MLSSATERALEEKVATVREAAGDRFEDLELDVFVADAGVVGGDQAFGASLGALVKSAGPAVVGGSPHVLYGTLGQLRDQLLRRRERSGVSAYGIPSRAMESFAPLLASLEGA
jgi:hypothetical protein